VNAFCTKYLFYPIALVVLQAVKRLWYDDWWMWNWKGFLSKWSPTNPGSVPIFAWRDREKPRTLLITIPSAPPEIRTGHVWNTSLWSCRFTILLGTVFDLRIRCFPHSSLASEFQKVQICHVLLSSLQGKSKQNTYNLRNRMLNN
jgi:hypothetical protein